MENYELTEELREALEKAASLDEMVLAFQKEGIEISKDQLEEVINAANDDLDENDLDAVAGGAIVGAYIRPVHILGPGGRPSFIPFQWLIKKLKK